MPLASSPPARAPAGPRQQWLWWALLALIWFGSLGTRALFSPDEGRYATLGLGMLQSGDWITPRLNGLLYFEKPALPYWITAASLAVFGVNEFAARFWPGLSGFLTVVAVGWTARRLWGQPSGAYAALLAASMAWIVANSHFLNLDMGLTFFLTLCLCAFLVAQSDDTPAPARRRAMWLCWAAMAGATLSKGLVGVVIPAAVLLLYSLAQRQFGFWRRMHWISGLAIFFALAAPWFIAVSLENPAFFDFFFIREHFRRFLTDEAQRTGAVWYFVPVLLAGLLPWTTLLPRLLWQGGGHDARRQFQPARVLLIWNLFLFVFFSISRSKLPSYILPMFPALALLGGRCLPALSARRWRWHLVLPALCWLAALLAWPLAGRWVSPTQPAEVVHPLMNMLALAALAFLLPWAAAHWLLGRDRRLPAVALVALGSVAGLTLAMQAHDHHGAHSRSSQRVAPLLAPYLRPDTPVYAVRFYDQSLPFYLRRPVTLVDYRDEFSFGQQAEPERWLPRLDDFVTQWQASPRAAAMMQADTYEELRRRQLPMRVLYQDWRRLVVVKPAPGVLP